MYVEGTHVEAPTINKIAKPVGIFIFFVTAFLVMLLWGALSQNASLRQNEWVKPAVGTSLNGYSGPVFSYPTRMP